MHNICACQCAAPTWSTDKYKHDQSCNGIVYLLRGFSIWTVVNVVLLQSDFGIESVGQENVVTVLPKNIVNKYLNCTYMENGATTSICWLLHAKWNVVFVLDESLINRTQYCSFNAFVISTWQQISSSWLLCCVWKTENFDTRPTLRFFNRPQRSKQKNDRRQH